MSQTLSDGLHDAAGGIGQLGDIDGALRDVRNRRIRVLVGTVAATCLAMVLVILTVPTPTSMGPVEPVPETSFEVLRSSDAVPSITSSPLPEGADVAAIGGQGFLVWSGGEPRLVAESSRGYWASLSPDGRLLARSDGDLSLREGTTRVDVLVVTDLTTGRDLLRWRMRVEDGPGQAPRYVWSGDSQTLLVTVMAGETWDIVYPPSMGELRVWRRSGEEMVEVGRPRPLPGMVVGVDEEGSTALVQDDNHLARLDLATGELRRTETLYSGYWGSGGPPQPWGQFNGQGCWDAVRDRVCHVIPASVDSTKVAWVDTRGDGLDPLEPRRTVEGELVTFAGWLEGDPVVVSVLGGGEVHVVRMTATGSVALRRFDASALLGPFQGGAFTVSVPEYR